MERRRFIEVIAGGLLAAPLAAEAQPAAKVARIGWMAVNQAASPHRYEAFRQGLRDLGYVEGRNVVIESRSAEAYSTPATKAARDATRTIPIVMSSVVDPVATGLVASLGRPGGNVTGLSLMAPELIGKQMQLLKELVPKVSRVAVLWNPANPSNKPQLRGAEAAARTLKLRLQPLEARDPNAFDSAFAAMIRERAGAVIVLVEGVFIDNRLQIARVAEKARLPAVYEIKEHAEAGGLMFYGASPVDLNRRAATFVDKILKGAKPADLPIEQPTKFELVINLKTAKALGLTIPKSLLQRADELIQ